MHSFLQGTPLDDVWQRLPRRHRSSRDESMRSIPTTSPHDNEATTVESGVADDDVETKDIDPRRWSLLKKSRVVAIITFYTFAVYAGSAIYIASVDLVAHEYTTSIQVALLGLSLYVLGYGVGPLLWGPLSEIPRIGRNPVYTLTTLIFLLLSIATAKTTSFPGFLVLRFVQGFFGSPCLANGGASLHDIFEGRALPLVQAVWVAEAYAGPAIGPLMASFLVEEHGWRIGMWEIVACAGAALGLLMVLPETYGPKILYQRRRGEAGSKGQSDREVRPDEPGQSRQPLGEKNNDRIRIHETLSEPSADTTSIRATLLSALTKPVQISIQDPAIAFVNLYTSYLYSCYYTFFDGFPLIYTTTYNFPPSHIGLVFLPIIVGCAVATLLYYIYILRSTGTKETDTTPEDRLRPALLAVFAVPIGIFLFGWTAEPSSHAHYIWGMLGLVLYAGGVFVILQCIIMYILESYPRFAASLFAANDFSRSALAAGAVHFGLPLYVDLGPGKACSVLGSVSVVGIAGMYVLWWKGAELRARSVFTMKD